VIARRALRQVGFTLAEMLAVAAILALGAAVAIPDASPLTALSVDAATAEITRAISFAQREAMRTGAWHAVRIDTTTQTLRVYRLTATGTEDTTIPVLHPIDKQTYNLAFNTGGGPARATITLVDFDYQGNSNLPTLSFDPDGTPSLLTSTKNNGVKAMTGGQVTIKTGASQRNLSVDIVTGRISG
jgi:prepilin-type N-terminal cleavage/methylation domain-containing protein